ncbi:MAG: 5-formyltetrahydrofolate cyclo-ligase [Legionellales bacterium]|nr:5-formyltetrahydrofolate cyclo-ligase [Legionellales bacterium]
MDLSQLRQHLIQQRLQLSQQAILLASQQVAERVSQLKDYQQANHLAAYCAVNNEIDPRSLIQQAWLQQKTVYLPVLNPNRSKQLLFSPFNDHHILQKNHLNIPEPQNDQNVFQEASCLDLVITPLVACDTAGHRIGMGGGFYDATFAFLNKTSSAKPILLGIAYDFQIIEKIIPNEWDVDLDIIVTPTRIFYAHS